MLLSCILAVEDQIKNAKCSGLMVLTFLKSDIIRNRYHLREGHLFSNIFACLLCPFCVSLCIYGTTTWVRLMTRLEMYPWIYSPCWGHTKYSHLVTPVRKCILHLQYLPPPFSCNNIWTKRFSPNLWLPQHVILKVLCLWGWKKLLLSTHCKG